MTPRPIAQLSPAGGDAGPEPTSPSPPAERAASWSSTSTRGTGAPKRGAAATVLDAGVPVRIDGHELAGSFGLKLQSGSRSSLCHSVRRLERFGLAGLN